MTAQDYQQLIVEGLDGLPPDALAEIADFVLFIRKRAMRPEAFQEEMRDVLLRAELKQLSRDEASHVEEEFEDYDRLYPRE
jgi:hypothetical protein